MNKAAFKHALTIAVTMIVAGCASTGESTHPQDPYESYNRFMFKVNRGVDKALVRPIAKTYDRYVFDFVKTGVDNFVTNLAYPVTIVNLLLQGKIEDSGVALGRFLLNSTAGIGGLADEATAQDIPRHDEDFGQTLAVWGWEESNYLMLPLLGPATLRDGIGMFGDSYTSGVNWAVRAEDLYSILGLDILNTRVQFLPRDDDIDEAADPYLFVRDAYLQNRDFKIRDGETELPAYEEFLQEGDNGGE